MKPPTSEDKLIRAAAMTLGIDAAQQFMQQTKDETIAQARLDGWKQQPEVLSMVAILEEILSRWRRQCQQPLPSNLITRIEEALSFRALTLKERAEAYHQELVRIVFDKDHCVRNIGLIHEDLARRFGADAGAEARRLHCNDMPPL